MRRRKEEERDRREGRLLCIYPEGEGDILVVISSSIIIKY